MNARGSAVLLLACGVVGQVAQGFSSASGSPEGLRHGDGLRSRPLQLQGVDGLVRVYDAILEARFERVDAELRRACPPAPQEACAVLAASALWWRIQLDPDSRALDAEFLKTANAAIESTEAWTMRAPDDAEAWFYLGGAYAVRVQWRVLRDEKVAAAREGKRILSALERALKLNPTLDDAYFAIGMYKYYADVAPRAARFLRMLLMLPGGDRKVGLAQMLRARERGQLLRGEADYQLHVIYLWYERQTGLALALLQDLREQYPRNPLFPSETARIQDEYLHDPTASLASWRAVLAAAREQRTSLPALAEVRARLAIASLLDRLHETDEAIDQLEAVVALRPSAPFGALGLAHARLGEAHDRLGNRDAALAAYRSATATISYPDVHGVRNIVSTRSRRAPDGKVAAAYRLSIEGLRNYEKQEFADAEAALERSLALNPADPVTHYRLGRALLRTASPAQAASPKRDPIAALAHFQAAIRGARNCPAPILGSAYLEAARLHEQAGRKDQAVSLYRVAASLFGAAAETRAVAARALARLGATD
jgi:tetratricopeptide (TPR) repeat protein